MFKLDILDFVLPIFGFVALVGFFVFCCFIYNTKQNEKLELIKKTENIYLFNNCEYSNNIYYCWGVINER